MVVGREASESVALMVAIPTVSGAHAMIEVSGDGGKVMVTDLSSTNGTFIEGQELEAGVAFELKEGGEVIFGDEVRVWMNQHKPTFVDSIARVKDNA